MISLVHIPFRKKTDKSCLCEKTNDFLRYYLKDDKKMNSLQQFYEKTHSFAPYIDEKLA